MKIFGIEHLRFRSELSKNNQSGGQICLKQSILQEHQVFALNCTFDAPINQIDYEDGKAVFIDRDTDYDTWNMGYGIYRSVRHRVEFRL